MSDTKANRLRPPLAKVHTDAVVVPTVARALAALVLERGCSFDQLCRGLGFDNRDLRASEIRISYRQTRTLVVRAQRLLADAKIGLLTGMRQTPSSWGPVGLGMMTCRTLGEAIGYAEQHQDAAGALLNHRTSFTRREFVLEVTSKVSDLEIERFLVEEAFSSVTAVTRRLIGADFNPLRVEFSYAQPEYLDAYTHLFGCPVRFCASGNRLIADARWLNADLPNHDEMTGEALRAQLDKLLDQRTSHRDELIEMLSIRLRANIEDAPALGAIARQLNMSERTLRRRLTDAGVSYRELFDQVRYERATDLMRNSRLSLTEIAQAVGFTEVRSFKRAFERWSGALPCDRRA